MNLNSIDTISDLLQSNSLFLSDWYLEQYPDVERSEFSAIEHYILYGWKENRWPSPLVPAETFVRAQIELELEPHDTQSIPVLTLFKYYVDGNKVELGLNQDKKYLQFVNENLISETNQIPLAEYQRVNRLIALLKGTLLSDYLKIKDSGLFDPAWYSVKYASVMNIKEYPDALCHYILYGSNQNFQPNPLFDPMWYRCISLPENERISGLPLVHYIEFGANKNYSPSPLFCPKLFEISKSETSETPRRREYLKYALAELPVSFSKYLNETGKEIATIENSGLFDCRWYRETCGDHELPEYNLIWHYVFAGWNHGLSPNEHFDAAWYENQFLRHEEQTNSPLYHYLEHGQEQFTSPNKNFNAPTYRQELKKHGVNQEPLAFYLSSDTPLAEPAPCHKYEGDKAFLSRFDLFDREEYWNRFPSLKGCNLEKIVEHYLNNECLNAVKPNKYFDPDWYFAQYCVHNETVFECSVFRYFLEYGRFLAHDPSPEFDTEKYIETFCPDISKSEAYLHFYNNHYSADVVLPSYTNKAFLRDLESTGLFLADWYHNIHEDLRGMDIDPLEHFALFGCSEGRRPNPYFDPKWYLSQYPYVRTNGQNPLIHYAQHGWKRNLNPSREFCTAQYLTAYPELKLARGNPLEHFLVHGKRRGYIAFPLQQKSEHVEAQQCNVLDKDALLPVDPSIRRTNEFKYRPLDPVSKDFDPKKMNVHWVVPDFSVGGGGHMTIFRMVFYLGLFGHRQTVWIEAPDFHKDSISAHDTIIKHYQSVDVDVRFLAESFLEDASGDVIIATGWSTVWPIVSAQNFKKRFYFVQDYEPSFYPVGTKSILAEQTYQQELDCICAGPWLQSLMQSSYGRWASCFYLSVDREIYYPRRYTGSNTVPKIAFYARHFTPRRVVELGMLALELLGKTEHIFHIDFFGADLDFKSAPFSFTNHGVLSPDELSRLYANADIGVVFSGTNYSLIPQEMMACNLPVVEIDSECTRKVFPENVITLAKPNPQVICDKIISLLIDPNRRSSQAKAALDWVGQFTWEDAARVVESSIKERLAEAGFTEKYDATVGGYVSCKQPLVTVAIPTYNGGQQLRKIIEKVLAQRVNFDYEILVVDSSSIDGTWDYVSGLADSVRAISIKQSDFQHGRTRNYAVEESRGSYVAFLTQDALPVDEFWLYNLVTPFKRDSSVAGVFGRHIAYDNASPFTRLNIDDHFKQFMRVPLLLNRRSDGKRYDRSDHEWRQLLHFYSDNNSCLRKEVWCSYPYPEIDFGEDQAWADIIIENGFTKAYAPSAVVMHSHDFTPAEQAIRSAEESKFFYEWFGYKLVDVNVPLIKYIEAANAEDIKWGELNQIKQEVVEAQIELNKARYTGYLNGIHDAMQVRKASARRLSAENSASPDHIT